MSDANPMIDHWCRTTSDTTDTTFQWTIEDFASRPEKNGEAMYSSSFLAKKPNKKDSMWQLMIYPRGDTKDSDRFLALYLKNDNDFPMKAKFQFSIIDLKFKKMALDQDNVIHSFEPKSAANCSWGSRRWTLRDPLLRNQQFLPGGHLTILCEVSIFGKEKISSGSSGLMDRQNNSKLKGMTKVIEQLGKLFNDKELSDIEVECGEEVFNCHQLILSTRSDVFRTMFQADMKENRTKRVTIKDFNPDVVKEMLHFIYTGATNENVLKEKAGELLAAAEKYQLNCLKEVCEDYLCSVLEVTNSISSLVLGDMHQAFKLRRIALRMVASNLTTIVPTEEYQDLVENHQAIVAEIPAAMVEAMTSK